MGPRRAALLAMQYQFEQSEWWPPETIRQAQYRQLQVLLHHAQATAPYYRKRFAAEGIDPDAPLDDVSWSKIPFLTRSDIQGAGDTLISSAIPHGHGRLNSNSTSGSTGAPVTTKGTELTQFFWLCFTLRDFLWRDFDLSEKFAAIRNVQDGRAKFPDGVQSDTWGRATSVFVTGPSVVLTSLTPVAQQAEWLQRQNPGYLLSYPSNLMALLEYCRDNKIRLPKLRMVQTFGELLFPEMRAVCRKVWGVEIADTYSSQEMGYIALQCPKHEHYHVQSESVLVEVLDENNRPCKPGETGRIVVTALHNFAMPLIRYVIGDYAVVGEPCPCGRGLPVLSRILGRVRNMLTLPTGGQLWPYFGGEKFRDMAPIRQYQIVQKSLTELELCIVPERPFTAQDEKKLRDWITGKAGKGFKIIFSYHEAIARGAGGKFEDFRSELKR